MKLQIDVPNVQTGHTSLIYDTSKPEEAKLAKEQIIEMMKAGFAIFIEKDGKTERVTKFNGNIGKYLIAGRDAVHPDADETTAKVTATAPVSGGCLPL